MENAQQEPSMEEILASIRRIISEDDEENTGDGETPSPIKTKPSDDAGAATPQEPTRETSERSGQPETDAPPNNAEEIEMIRENVATALAEDSKNTILDRTAADAASQAFDNLSQQVRITSGSGRTLEEVVMEILKPLIKEWLDNNLPTIVEQKVEEEVQRVSQRRW